MPLARILCLLGVHRWRFKESRRGHAVKFCPRCTRFTVLYTHDCELQHVEPIKNTPRPFPAARIFQYSLIGALVLAVIYLDMDRRTLQRQFSMDYSPASAPLKNPTPSQDNPSSASLFEDINRRIDQSGFVDGADNHLPRAFVETDGPRVATGSSSLWLGDGDTTAKSLVILKAEAAPGY